MEQVNYVLVRNIYPTVVLTLSEISSLQCVQWYTKVPNFSFGVNLSYCTVLTILQ